MTAIVDARAKLAAVLQPVEDTDPVVLTNLVDGIQPPALMLGWGEPWLTPTTGCFADGRLVITAVSSRLLPGEGVADLETLIVYVLGRLRSDAGPWPLADVSGPRAFVVGKIPYLAARITLRIPVSLPT